MQENERAQGAPLFGLWCSARRVGDNESPRRGSYALKSSARQKCIVVVPEGDGLPPAFARMAANAQRAMKTGAGANLE
jgi:hypothetical protein